MNYLLITIVLNKVQIALAECGDVCSSFLHLDESHDLAACMAARTPWSIDDGDDRLVNWSPKDRTLLVSGAAYRIPDELIHRVSWALANDTDFSTEEKEV